ncbi:MAG: esterase/lipase family protein [Candidatus Thorarchaeota archaeon]
MNSKRVVISILMIVIMITPAIGVNNFDFSNEPTLWILKTESGDVSIDVGLDEIRLGLRDTVSDVRVRNLESLNTLDAKGDYLIIIGHGIPEGLETNGKIQPWDEVYAAIRNVGPERAFILACYSPVDEEIIGFNAPIDAKAGAMLISWMICGSLESEKQSDFPVEDAIAAQREMKNPLNRYVYFVHGYFGSDDDFETMIQDFVLNHIEYSYSGIRYFDYFEHYGLGLPVDVLAIDALHQITSISEYANNFADDLCDLPSGSHVSIVAHSMGGIITREMLGLHRDDLAAAGVCIDNVITLGTPNLGTWLANPINPWSSIMTSIGGVINFGQFWPAQSGILLVESTVSSDV